MSVVVRVENLGKLYRIGGSQEKYSTMRDTLANVFTSPFKRVQHLLRGEASGASNLTESFWALKDVSFEVKQGEILGIVGRNGAGKSTLLKILSRITEPTEGFARIRGRIGSLLEVGTGFHPELTGRENVYLNGAILGMSKSTINQRLDEIVAFSGVEKFIDTPVKHYSSGMYLRLAFAVAAHLEPEILVIDEVLAVGDAEFQRKCIGKMNDVAKGGRTVLFVSHNIVAVSSLCTHGLMLKDGFVGASGTINKVIDAYQASIGNVTNIPLSERKDRRGNGTFRFVNIQIIPVNTTTGDIESGGEIAILIDCQSDTQQFLNHLLFSIEIVDSWGNLLFTCHTDLTGVRLTHLSSPCQLICRISSLPLAPGIYRLNVWGSSEGPTADHVLNAAQFTVIEGDFFGTGKLPEASKQGAFLVPHTWTIQARQQAGV